MSDIWAVIAERTGAAHDSRTATHGTHRFTHWARSVATTYAVESYTRVGDIGVKVAECLPDICQDAREIAVARISQLATSDEAYPVFVCDTECTHSECATAVERGYSEHVTVSGRPVIGWWVATLKRCGACDRCRARRGACTNPRDRAEWLAVDRIIGASLKGAARRAFKRSRTEYGAPEVITETADATQSDAPTVCAVPTRARDLMARVADACTEAGEPVTAANGAWSTYAGDMMAVILGYQPTERGRRSARSALMSM
jgi:hypothetical protein